MRALELDFQRPPRPSRFGWLVLVAGVAALAALLASQRMLAEQTAARRVAVQRTEAILPGAGAARAPKTKDDAALAAARQAVERSSLPWNSLFAALEAADDKDVALLAVTPDAARGKVKIHAEARHLTAMLAFHQRLQQSQELGQVALVDHEIAKESAEQPVRFHIVANWGAAHGHP